MSGFKIIAPGILSLIQDAGRIGRHQIGLTTGGPLDPEAFRLANVLCHNNAAESYAAIELSIGGLTMQAQVDTLLAVTGADIPLSINDQAQLLWQTHAIKAGDKISFGFASNNGCRSYIAVSGGFKIEQQFGSVSTVVREGIGGLDGHALKKGDLVPCEPATGKELLYINEEQQLHYPQNVELRVIEGYQQQHFSDTKKALFYSSEYTVSDRCDRMGYRLEGPKVDADIEGILSEGICFGAIQVPADGQPIVLMNDRQTIGGYPKIGSVLASDMSKLGQLTPGCKVRFTPISIDDAHQITLLTSYRQQQILACTLSDKE